MKHLRSKGTRMHYTMLNKTKYLLVFTLSIYTHNIGAMLHQQALKTCLQKMPLQKMMRAASSNKPSLWLHREGSSSAGENVADALLGTAGGLVGITLGAGAGLAFLHMPYYYLANKDFNEAWEHSAALGAVIGGVTGSFIGGGPIGLAAFSTVMASCYAVGKINKN
jgi:uncharacterized protein YcfJ